MANTYFVTGTDTDVGKTVVACGLLKAAAQQDLTTLALKPIASGCDTTPEGLRNSDALALQAAMSCELPYDQINPVAFAPAIAPHIAAQQQGSRVTLSQLAGYCRGALTSKHDFSIVEGAGGWYVPLNRREMLSGLAKELNLPVILVVGMKLGCINHALLSVNAILREGITLAGWVANQVNPNMSCVEENLQTLADFIPAPCLGVVPFLEDTTADNVASFLTLPML